MGIAVYELMALFKGWGALIIKFEFCYREKSQKMFQRMYMYVLLYMYSNGILPGQCQMRDVFGPHNPKHLITLRCIGCHRISKSSLKFVKNWQWNIELQLTYYDHLQRVMVTCFYRSAILYYVHGHEFEPNLESRRQYTIAAQYIR